MQLHPLFRTLAFSLGFAAVFSVQSIDADVATDTSFTAFSNVDVNALAGGQVLQARGGLIEFQRGLTAQSLYIINAAPADVQHKLISWEPASHGELKVWMHHSLPARPTVADFNGLQSLPDNSSVAYLLNATSRLDPNNPGLQVNRSEAQLIASLRAQGGSPRALVANAWSQILSGRMDHFLSADWSNATYISSEGNIDSLSEIKSLLRSDARVYQRIHPLLAGTPLYASTKTPSVDRYYECFDVEGGAALGTGAVYQAQYPIFGQPAPANPADAPIVSADIEFYVNYGIYISIELEQMSPVTVNGRTATLVWRDDLVSTSNIAYLHGTERLASGMIMLQDVKQAIDAFRSEFR